MVPHDVGFCYHLKAGETLQNENEWTSTDSSFGAGLLHSSVIDFSTWDTRIKLLCANKK